VRSHERSSRQVLAQVLVFVGILLAVGAIASATVGAAAGSRSDSHPCAAAVSFSVVPSWARTGFSAPKPRLPHAIGRRGEIAALLFGHPLSSPPALRRNNKILWVSRRDAVHSGALWIRAQRMAGATAVGQPVTRIVQGGPGPSIVNVPAPGCWRLALAWSGRTDSLDLRYEAP